jgi:glutathione S-transferase
MKLYYAPSACSLSPHIISNELNLPMEFIRIDTKTKKTENGEDFFKISPKGYVPALVLDDGTLLTEGPVIVQYLAESANNTELLPEARSMGRYKAMEILNFITSELHKSFSPLFNRAISDDVKSYASDKVKERINLLDTHLLGDKPFLMGDKFTVCDAYCFTVLNWTSFVDIELSPNLKAYQQRVASRPAVQKSMREEGLIK